MRVRKFVALFMLVMVGYFSYHIYSSYPASVDAATYKWGSRGSTVTEIQRRLRNWGYYSGPVDGIYGYQTYLAVKKFQSKNGIGADGIVGPKTLSALGINSGASTTSISGSSNLTTLARAIHGEARGEPYIGQVAVGAVIMNRTRDPKFPGTIPGVIYQPGAFTAVTDGQINLPAGESATKAANDSLNGWDPSGGAIYYFNPDKATSKWIWSRPIIKVIGKHYFCK